MEIMLQGFEWHTPADGKHWTRIARKARALRRLGITQVWLPPACKGAAGPRDAGYGIYDLYDLGEFDQKGSIATKYGTKAEYLAAIRALHRQGIAAIADIVLNHRIGADESETVTVMPDDPEHRGTLTRPAIRTQLKSRFTFPGRGTVYSDFAWDARRFTGTDWDEGNRTWGLYLIQGKQWAPDVDTEKGNYDYLMGLDVDVCDPEVRTELARWGVWYLMTTGADGFRLDAVKHISAGFYRDWLPAMRKAAHKPLPTVGEYWHGDVNTLLGYLDRVHHGMRLFDVPLHYNLCAAANSDGAYDMRRLYDGTLTAASPDEAVTFVDNHDTQPGQSLESWVGGWFKAAAYALILLRGQGVPCVFWGDLYGIPESGVGAVPELPQLLRIARDEAHGERCDFFDDPDLVGFTRTGDSAHPGSGLAFLCTNRLGGTKRMFLGAAAANRRLRCVIGGQPPVRIDSEGWAELSVRDGGCSVYVLQHTLPEKLLRAGRQAAEEGKRVLGYLFRRS